MQQFRDPSQRVKNLTRRKSDLIRKLQRFTQSPVFLVEEHQRSAWLAHTMRHLALTERALRFNLSGDETGFI
jgi:hypothetical protein